VTPSELAKKLHGREIGEEFTREDRLAAKDAGLIVVYGYSDDCVEVDGASTDELGFDPILFHRRGLLPYHERGCDCKFCGYSLVAKQCKTVKGKFTNEGWRFETDIPHATFDIMEDGSLFCRGIVFSLSDCPEVKL